LRSRKEGVTQSAEFSEKIGTFTETRGGTQLKMAAAGFLLILAGQMRFPGCGLPVQLGNGVTISFEVDLCNGKVAA
jgi:hypothetical protein